MSIFPSLLRPVATPEASLADFATHRSHLSDVADYGRSYRSAEFANALCSITFDDIPTTDYVDYYPLFKARAIPVGYAVWWAKVGAVVGSGITMTPSQLLEMQARGVEMIAHTRTHGADPVSWDAYLDEVITATAEMRAAKLDVRSFAQPGTWVNSQYLMDSLTKLNSRAGDVLRSNFASSAAYVAEDAANDWSKAAPAVYRYGAQRVSMDSISSGTLTGAIDKAIRYKGYLHFGAHSNNISTATLTTVLDYLVTKRDAGLIDILSPTAAMFAQRVAARTNLCTNPAFETALASDLTGWVANGSPTLPASGRTGNALLVTSGNDAYQWFMVKGLRHVLVQGYAKSNTGSPNSAKIRFRSECISPASAGGYETDVSTPFTSVTNAGWTRVQAVFGVHPDSTHFRIWLAHGAGDGVLWDDITVQAV